MILPRPHEIVVVVEIHSWDKGHENYHRENVNWKNYADDVMEDQNILNHNFQLNWFFTGYDSDMKNPEVFVEAAP